MKTTKEQATRWSVRTYDKQGKFTGYLRHRDRTEWTRRTADKHRVEFMDRHGTPAVLEQVD